MSDQSFPFEIIEEYVRGGCSVIYKIKPLEGMEDGDWLLKTMSLGDDEDSQSYQRFYMEYEFLRAYPHPNLIQVQAFYRDWHGRPGYVMERIQGMTWQNFWRDKPALENVKLLLKLLRQLCDGLDFIHKHQIIHRDLKPQNVLVSEDCQVKIIDFGIMKVADLTMYTQRNTFMGSAYYVAPEGVSGEPIDKKADIFSLGVILYDLFTGMKPFQGHTIGETIYQRLAKKPQPPSHIADIPEALDEVLLKMLARNPRDRYGSCGEAYAAICDIFGEFQPTPVQSDAPTIDILTKGPFFHGHSLQAFENQLKEKNILYLVGEAGSGKTTIVENLCARLHHDVLIKLDCGPNSNELEFMEVLLRNIETVPTKTRQLRPWKEILASAFPSLKWEAQNLNQSLTQGTIMSAFIQVFTAAKGVVAVLIENVQDAPPSLFWFLQRLVRLFSERTNPNLYLAITSRESTPELSGVGLPFHAVFPDPVDLADFLVAEFGDCQIPLELTQRLAELAENNIGNFVQSVQKLKLSDRLTVENGVLKLCDEEENEALYSAETVRLPTLPSELWDFEGEQLRHLEWIALCPDDIDLNMLKLVAHASVDDLSATMAKAAERNLLAFHSSATEGFRWKNQAAQNYLLSTLSHDEKTKRFHELARSIERETTQFLSYSPPLWLTLCRLYQQAAEDDKASDYGFRYARYCFQNANFEQIRAYLSQFHSLPKFQRNQEFWCMLALAHRNEDLPKALEFAERALNIEENIEALALLAILEYHASDLKGARARVDRILQQTRLGDLEIHYAYQLLPIMLAFEERNGARALYKSMINRLKGRTDLFATNTLALAGVRIQRDNPAAFLKAAQSLEQELLPQTRQKLSQWASLSYQELGQRQNAMSCLKALDSNDYRFFRDAMFLHLNFQRTTDLKKTITAYRKAVDGNKRLARLKPLAQLITEILVQDPAIYDSEHVAHALGAASVDQSMWLTLVVSILEPRLVSGDFVSRVLEGLSLGGQFWARHQVPRLNILADVKAERPGNLVSRIDAAVARADQYGLVMEKARLFALARSLKIAECDLEKIDFRLPPELLESPDLAPILKVAG